MTSREASKTAHVIGTGSYLPAPALTNDELERFVGALEEEVMAGISIQRRYWLVDPATGEHRDSNSGMALRAVQRALEAALVTPAEVELLVLATGTPDYPLPPVVNLVQDGLGLEKCATIELRSGGAGAVQALDIARMYLERGIYRTAVVVGSEAISPAMVPVFLGKDPDSIRMRDRIPLFMFGDGAGAIVLQAADSGRGIVGSAMACIGGGKKPGIQAFGGTHAPIHQQVASKRFPDLRVDVVESERFTPRLVMESIGETLRRTATSAEAIDLCLIPEGNVNWMLEGLEKSGGGTSAWRALEGRIYDDLAQTGATGCAAVPIFLDRAWRSGRLAAGDLIMLIGLENTKWIYAGVVLEWTAAPPPAVPAENEP